MRLRGHAGLVGHEENGSAAHVFPDSIPSWRGLPSVRHCLRPSGDARRRDGRRQELLARRDDQLPGQARGTGAGRLRHHRAGLSRFPRAGRPRRAHPRRAGHARRRRRRQARRRRRADPRVDSLDALPAASSKTAVREACARMSGGRDIAVAVRSRPPPKTCRTPRSPASRKPSSTCAARTTC